MLWNLAEELLYPKDDYKNLSIKFVSKFLNCFLILQKNTAVLLIETDF